MGAARADDQTNAGASPIGEWLVAKQLARIKIVNCDGRLWGVVSWEMHPGVDSKNPDPNLRSRPTLGMPILLGMNQSQANQWDGQIYNSQDGNTYSANIKLLNPGTLRVEGCVFGFLCGGENWTRVDPGDVTSNAQTRRPPARKTRAGATPPAGDDVCLSILGPAWLSHQRGLK
ncbi:MAG: DUF2147 domain-containing protein [Limisphaerales bacterium]